MKEEMTRHYLNHMPVEMREAIKELHTDNKWAVFIALTLEEKKYFNEIKTLFDANPNTIDTILKSLVASGLITKKVERLSDAGNRERSYYMATPFGHKLLDTLYEVVLPPLSSKPDSKQEYASQISLDLPEYRTSGDALTQDSEITIETLKAPIYSEPDKTPVPTPSLNIQKREPKGIIMIKA